jgi:ABC-type polysaccharide/polyol phosphate transport system ATPase subunit
MKDEVVIKFENVSKKFRKGRKLLLKEALLDIFKPGRTEEFWVLDDINFEVKKGETLGIIGQNGSGKSTILKLIAGVTSPTKGKVEVKGKIAPLIELGAGFHPELTGRENIYINGIILGLSKEEIDQKFDEIVTFAELEDFIDTPLKHYSTGMYMRLGFAIAVNVNPDILLVDEVLAVGDEAFQIKCLEKMNHFNNLGVTIIFVSHALKVIENFCNRVIYLNNSRVVVDTISSIAISKFRKSLLA